MSLVVGSRCRRSSLAGRARLRLRSADGVRDRPGRGHGRPIAAVHASVSLGGGGAAWRPALDKVWAFLRSHEGLRTDGHNIFVYRHPVGPGASMEVDFGVEVSRPFEGEGDIVFTYTPAGRVASTVHVGPPDQIAGANTAIEEWCRAKDRSLAGVSWEIYGDPGDDPATFEVKVFYLLG